MWQNNWQRNGCHRSFYFSSSGHSGSLFFAVMKNQFCLFCAILLFMAALSSQANAAALTCSGTSDVGGDYTIPHSGINITAPNTGNAGSDSGLFALLYTVDTSIPGGSGRLRSNCSGGAASIGYTINNIPAGKVYTYSGYTIYPTTVKGIGVSFNSATSANKKTMPAWPTIDVLYSSLPGYNVDMWVTIRVWKTPEFTYQTNAINFTGPDFDMVVQANGGNTIGTCPEDRLDDRTCLYFQRTLIGSAQFISGTCQLTNPAQVVDMGALSTADLNNAPWVDASFSLNCPTAYGYGGSVHNATDNYDVENGSKSGNNTKNNTVKIEILPYTPIVDKENGVMSVDSGGAEGVGIQLAWGKAGEQQSTPINPVKLGEATNISTLNSNFSNGPYNYGSNASSSQDNVINMAARFVRTAGDFSAGPVHAAVEVMASYE
ncbi:TPA: fimbrial protein [Citrobacter amalonaticus]|jgi:hypothetical protein|nr:fimbrial protein [Citrobacter amalonaticus]MDT7075264.1 hypothetical protein [Citrobacter amalonaticus]